MAQAVKCSAGLHKKAKKSEARETAQHMLRAHGGVTDSRGKAGALAATPQPTAPEFTATNGPCARAAMSSL